MTKEQRERLHDHHASEALEWDEYASGASAYSSREDSRKMAAMHRAALELLTDRAEADRVLGARVRTWIDGESADQLDEFADVLSNPMFLGSETSPAVELVRAIASALREEG